MKRPLYATSTSDIRDCIEVIHPSLTEPARMVNDNEPLTIGTDVYAAVPFAITLPDSKKGQLPQAQISIDNVSRELTDWLETSNGGKGAKCRVIETSKSHPSDLIIDVTLDLTDIQITDTVVTGKLGYVNTFALPAVTVMFTPTTTPNLWP